MKMAVKQTTKKNIRSKGKKLGSLAVNRVHLGDARALTKQLPSSSVAVTITSPPYFDMKNYGVAGQVGFGQTYDAYLDDLAGIFSNIFEATRAGGSLWVVIDTFRRNQEVAALPFDLSNRLKGTGWTLRDIIIWKKERTLPWIHEGATRKIFEYVLVFGKNAEKHLYKTNSLRDSTDLKRWWVRYPERYNPKGKSLEEIWTFDIPTQGSWGAKQIRHFCPLPPELVDRVIELTTNPGDVVLDPFAGSGTVPAEAAAKGRKYLGFELNPEYLDLFDKYIVSGAYKARVAAMRNDPGDEGEFEATIKKLRVLKFGRLLARALLKDWSIETRVVAELTAEAPSNETKQCKARFTLLLLNDDPIDDVATKAQAIAAAKPLSKFGIEFSIITKRMKNHRFDPELTYYLYSMTNSHKFQASSTGADIRKSKLPLISTLGLRVEEPNG